MAHSVNSFRLVQVAGRAGWRADGGEFLRRTVQGFRFDAARARRRLVTDGGDLAIDKLVIAAGGLVAPADRPSSAQRCRSRPSAAIMFMLPNPGVFPAPCRRANKDHGFAATPMENGLRFAGTGRDRRRRRATRLPPRQRSCCSMGKDMYPGLNTEGMTELDGGAGPVAGPTALPVDRRLAEIPLRPSLPSAIRNYGA